jgi:hypothetical protein
MGLDIRTPIGLMFAIFGLLLAGYGLATSGSPIYERSLGYNVNLEWGAVLLAFGALMLWLGRSRGGAAPARWAPQPPRRARQR